MTLCWILAAIAYALLLRGLVQLFQFTDEEE